MLIVPVFRQTEGAVCPRHEGLAALAACAPAVGVLPLGVDGEEVLQRGVAVLPQPLVFVADGAELLLAEGRSRTH